ncbi:MAG TPA: DNA gyrase inhibitor YacG [Azospirillaceae bacterium]|nr:DNA gyrase inhibitor YacG [Azospirillaceae bacterium]
MSSDPIDLSRAKPRRATCAVCGRPQEPAFKPFCSRRCADVDLARWLNGVYRVPVAEPGEGDDEGGGKSDAEP